MNASMFQMTTFSFYNKSSSQEEYNLIQNNY